MKPLDWGKCEEEKEGIICVDEAGQSILADEFL